MPSTIGFLREYLRPRSHAVQVSELLYHREGKPLPATLYRPASGQRRLPAWVLLHGLTCSGRQHPSLDRFARAVAASGAVVLVPEVPEWCQLQVAAAVTGPTILGAAQLLAGLEDVDPDRIGVIGFSFGATQALVAATEPGIETHVRGIAAWGGYCDLHSLFVFGITGEHELDGVRYRLDPDPYGRWIMGANYLTGIPGYEDHRELAEALRRLAVEAGTRRTHAWDPAFDPVKAKLREALPAAQRTTFDIFAPPAGRQPPDLEHARALALELADAALRAEPLLDPRPALPCLGVRTLVAHGRDDRLVPFTEGLRLARALPADQARGTTVTSLFAHSGGADRQLGPLGLGREAWRFVRLLQRILTLV
jgi:pimeloyl-ACP methyl ester carboxylesterase